MSALFSALAAKAVVFICSFLLATTGLSVSRTGTAKRSHKPFKVVTQTVSTDQEDESADQEKAAKDSLTAARKAEEEARRKEAEAERKARQAKEKSVKITISDEGIKVGGKDGKEKVIFEVDPKDIDMAVEDLEYSLEFLEDLPDSLAMMLLEDDDRGYVKIRGQDIVRFAGDIHIGRRELVQGDVVCIAGDITIEGKVRGNVVNVFGDTELHGTAVINGDVVTVMGELSEYNNPRIRGETVSVAGGSPNIHIPMLHYGAGNVWDVVTRVIKFIIFALLLLMIIYFLPDRMRVGSDHVFGSFFKSLGIGILVLLVGSVVVLILGVILSITIIGIPVALLLILSYGALLLLGYFVSALAVGRLLCRKFGPNDASSFLCGFMGLFLLTLPGFIAAMMWIVPFMTPIQLLLKTIAVFFGFLAVTVGSGSLIISKAGVLHVEQRPEVPEVAEITDPAAPAVEPQEPEAPEWPGDDEE